MVGEHLPDAVVLATLEKVLPVRFLPLLFKENLSAKSADIHFSLMGTYALHVLHKNIKFEKSTRDRQRRALNLMVACWGALPVGEILPERCADDLLKMETTAATECVALLRQLIPAALTGVVENVCVWDKYTQAGRKKRYSPSRRVRSVLLNNPPAPGKIEPIIKRCLDGIAAGVEAEKYLATLIMMCERVTLEEICALRLKSMTALPGYDDHYGLLIEDYVVAHGTRKKNDGHVRGQRHTIEKMEAPDKRVIGVAKIASDAWDSYRTAHPDYGDARLLLSSPQNANRVLAPDIFMGWLDEHFGDLFPVHSAIVEGKVITTNFDAEAHLITTACFLLEDCSCYSEEEIRYHYGETPKHMDAKHYAGFDAPSEIVAMGEFQNLAIAKLCSGVPDQGKSRKSRKILGIPNKTTHIHLEINAKELMAIQSREPKDLQFRMIAHGFNARIKAYKKGECD